MAWIESKQTKKGKRFYVYWYEGGKRHCQRAGNLKAAAIDIRNTIDGKVIGREAGLPDYTKTINELAQEYITQSKSTKKPRTIEHIRYGLNLICKDLGNRKLIGIKKQDIELFKNKLIAKRSVNGVNIILNPVSAMFSHGVRMGYIKTNPATGIMEKPVRVARFLSKEEFEKLFNALRYNKELEKIVRFALHTGMRQSEILKVKREDIRNGMILVEETKTGHPRMVPIHKEIMQTIMNVKSGQIFQGWTKNRLTRAFRRAVIRSGIGRFRFHDLRHCFCSLFLQAGASTAELQQVSGHKTLSSLQIYAHFQQSHLKDRINMVKIW